jgi:hypothetical protein
MRSSPHNRRRARVDRRHEPDLPPRGPPPRPDEAVPDFGPRYLCLAPAHDSGTTA